jgi:hypothetical protein
MKKKFKIDVWDCYVTLFTNPEQFAKETKCSTEIDDMEYFHLSVFNGRDCAILIDMSAFKAFDSSFVRTLSHECNHAAMSILGGVGVKYSFKHQEALAYTQDCILDKCYEWLVKNYKFENLK